MKKLLTIFSFSLLIAMLAGCDSTENHGPQPNKNIYKSILFQEKMLKLSGLSTVEFFSEVFGQLVSSGIALNNAEAVTKSLDEIFEIKCLKVCIIRLRGEK